jgi:hypothetical protein
MKLKAVHTYQYARFQNKNENFFTAKADMPDLEMELQAVGSTAVISIKSSKDHILLFPTNVAYAIPLTDETAKRPLANRGSLKDNEPSAPRK